VFSTSATSSHPPSLCRGDRCTRNNTAQKERWIVKGSELTD
jgi:hypothetical protein